MRYGTNAQNYKGKTVNFISTKFKISASRKTQLGKEKNLPLFSHKRNQLNLSPTDFVEKDLIAVFGKR